MLDEHRWNMLITRLTGRTPPGAFFSRLVTAYSESHRYYHNLAHIQHCLKEFDEAVNLFESPDEAEFAIWLHDMVYDPHATNNEEMSALIAAEFLSNSNCSTKSITNIHELILSTKHIQRPKIHDAQLLVDIDLSILGQAPAIFDLYEKNIRSEYSWVPEETYKKERSKILQGFMERTPIYSATSFERRYGKQARENIKRTLITLAYSNR